jgi:universal stress protein A
MKILLAVSQSEASEAAVKFLKHQMALPGAEVRLLHVLDPYPERLAQRMGSHDKPDFTSARRMQLELAENLLHEATEELSSATFVVTSSTREGDVAAMIFEEAKTWRANLIVVGWHQRKGIRSFFSSTSQKMSPATHHVLLWLYGRRPGQRKFRARVLRKAQEPRMRLDPDSFRRSERQKEAGFYG